MVVLDVAKSAEASCCFFESSGGGMLAVEYKADDEAGWGRSGPAPESRLAACVCTGAGCWITGGREVGDWITDGIVLATRSWSPLRPQRRVVTCRVVPGGGAGWNAPLASSGCDPCVAGSIPANKDSEGATTEEATPKGRDSSGRS